MCLPLSYNFTSPEDAYFELNALVVVKPNEIINERTSLRKRGKLVTVDIFQLVNGKEILSQSIVPKGAGSRSSFPVLTWRESCRIL